MFSLLKWAAAPAIGCAMLFAADTPQAEASDSFRLQVGRFGIHVGGGYHGHHGHHRSYYSPYRSHYGGHYGGHYRSHRGFHDTSHFDYHPPQVVPHRGHFDYVPGHYDYHRSGHWHH